MKNPPNKIILARNLIEERKTKFTLNSIPNNGINVGEWIQSNINKGVIDVGQSVFEVLTQADVLAIDTSVLKSGDVVIVEDWDGNGNSATLIWNGEKWIITSQQGLSTLGSNQNIISVPSQSVSFNELGFGFINFDLGGSGTAVTLTLTDPTEGGLYTLGFQNVGIGTSVTFPSNVKSIAGLLLGTVNFLVDTVIQLVYNGTEYIIVNLY